ncbi:MAG: DHH family phosphoesterase [Candidatus Thermoplasmatota archaeon]|nr:DHH family phosphoesterase [Candidatus Thermoplasmatota archaeon]
MRTLIMTHGDVDGICSGAMTLSAMQGKADVLFSNPTGLLEDLNAADRYDRIFISDIAIDEKSMHLLRKRFKELADKKDITYIDHHPLPKDWPADNLRHDENKCTSQLVHEYFRISLPKEMERVAVIGALGDYDDDTEYIDNILMDWDKRSLYFQAGILIQASFDIGRNYDRKRSILKALSTGRLPSDMPGILEAALNATRDEENMRIQIKSKVKTMRYVAYVIGMRGSMAKAAIYAGAYGNKLVGASAEFRDSKNVYDFSFRVRDGIDINEMLRAVAPKFGGSGGGHKFAGGARIPAERIQEFLQTLDDVIYASTIREK